MLGRRGLVQQGEALVAVAGQDDSVEMLAPALALQHHIAARRRPEDRTHRRVQAHLMDRRQQRVDVMAGAAGDGPPLRTVIHLQQAVVVAKADQRADRELEHLRRRARPDAGDHGQQIPVAKRASEAMPLQEAADRLSQRGFIATRSECRAKAVEAQQVGEHAPEVRAQQVAALGEDRAQIAAAPLHVLARHLGREAHVAFSDIDAQLLEQLDQQRVGAFVEDQEAGVHAVRDALQRDVDRVGVAAGVVTGFEQRDVSVAAQRPGGRQAGDAAANNRNALARLITGRPRMPSPAQQAQQRRRMGRRRA
mmetsp:Transcript_3279/g.11507  ORF Transcript_3279/g.11507 Transcript_3279/m.11507 type:complete len:308 (+) Transcript_3279:2464-3387(+)